MQEQTVPKSQWLTATIGNFLLTVHVCCGSLVAQLCISSFWVSDWKSSPNQRHVISVAEGKEQERWWKHLTLLYVTSAPIPFTKKSHIIKSSVNGVESTLISPTGGWASGGRPCSDGLGEKAADTVMPWTIPSWAWSLVQAAPGFGVQDLGPVQLGMVLLYTGVPLLHNHASSWQLSTDFFLCLLWDPHLPLRGPHWAGLRPFVFNVFVSFTFAFLPGRPINTHSGSLVELL